MLPNFSRHYAVTISTAPRIVAIYDENRELIGFQREPTLAALIALNKYFDNLDEMIK